MRTLPLLLVGCAAFGAGAVLGSALPGGGHAETKGGSREAVVFRTPGGERIALSLEEAAARLSELEETRRVRRRSEPVEREAAEPAVVEADGDDLLVGPDGRPFGPEELRRLALEAADPRLRLAAIRALRRDDSEEARGVLEALLVDPAVPAEARVEAAAVLARPPHRDHVPEELIRLLAEVTDPDVRRALVEGVARLDQRGAWMSEIVALFAEETDPVVRARLFEVAARSANDPAARGALLAVASDAGASAQERGAALDALRRGRLDPTEAAAVLPLLADPDPAVRERAVRLLGSSRRLALPELGRALLDDAAGVREAALADAARALGAARRRASSDEYAAALERVERLALSDPDPDVRRAGVSAARRLPPERREAVLAAARNDPDLHVRLAGYAASPREVAMGATDLFVGALSADDRAASGFAYEQLRRMHGVRVPYSARWNPKARAAAADEIRRVLSTVAR